MRNRSGAAGAVFLSIWMIPIFRAAGQNGRCDGDEIPNIFFDVFSIAVAGVEMPMIVVIRKRVEASACC